MTRNEGSLTPYRSPVVYIFLKLCQPQGGRAKHWSLRDINGWVSLSRTQTCSLRQSRCKHPHTKVKAAWLSSHPSVSTMLTNAESSEKKTGSSEVENDFFSGLIPLVNQHWKILFIYWCKASSAHSISKSTPKNSIHWLTNALLARLMSRFHFCPK